MNPSRPKLQQICLRLFCLLVFVGASTASPAGGLNPKWISALPLADCLPPPVHDRLYIWNQAGQLIQAQNWTTDPRGLIPTVESWSLPRGVYLLSLQSEEGPIVEDLLYVP